MCMHRRILKEVCNVHAGIRDRCQISDRTYRGSKETLLGFVHFGEIFCGQFYSCGLTILFLV